VPKNEKKLKKLRARALRRGDKLANTLRKLAAKYEPNDDSVGTLLKQLELVLPHLRRLSGEQDSPHFDQDARRVEKDSRSAGHEAQSPPKSRSRKDKRRPASASAIAV